jgi:Ca2+-binding EF-hand superfamily protein
LKDEWSKIDTDGNGTFNSDELAAAIKDGKLSPDAMKAAKLLATNPDLLKELDGDGDGIISVGSLDEKIKRGPNVYNNDTVSKWNSEKKQYENTPEQYDRAWKYDQSNKPFITGDGEGLNEKGWDAIKGDFGKIDRNGDGDIDSEDLKAALNNDQVSGDAKKAINLLLTNSSLMNEMDTANGGNPDGKFSPGDFDRMKAKTLGRTYKADDVSKWDDSKKTYVGAKAAGTAWGEDSTLTNMKTADGKDIKKEGYKALLDNYDAIKDKEGNVTPASLEAAVNSGKLSGDALKAAKLLMTNKDLLSKIDNKKHGGDLNGNFSKEDLQAYYDSLG